MTAQLFEIIITNTDSYTRARLCLCNRWLSKRTVEVSLECNLAWTPLYERSAVNTYLGIYPRVRDRGQVIAAYKATNTSEPIKAKDPLTVTNRNYPTIVWCHDYHLTRRLHPRQLSKKNASNLDIDLFIYGDISMINDAIKRKYTLTDNTRDWTIYIVALFTRGYSKAALHVIERVRHIIGHVAFMQILRDAVGCIHVGIRDDNTQFNNRFSAQILNYIHHSEHDKFVADTKQLAGYLSGEVTKPANNDALFAMACGGCVTSETSEDLLSRILVPVLIGIMAQDIFDAVVKASTRCVDRVLSLMLRTTQCTSTNITIAPALAHVGAWYAVDMPVYVHVYTQLLMNAQCIGLLFHRDMPEYLYVLTWQQYIERGQTVNKDELVSILGTIMRDDAFERVIKLVIYEYNRGILAKNDIAAGCYTALTLASNRGEWRRIQRIYGILDMIHSQ